MKTENLYYHFIFILLAFNSINTSAKEDISMKINVATAGSLLTQLGNKVDIVNNLTLSGYLNGTDIRTMREMDSLSTLDLTDANIVSGGDPIACFQESSVYSFCYRTENNKIGNLTFTGCRSLTSIILPKSVIEYTNGVFYETDGSKLTEIHNKSLVPPIATLQTFDYVNKLTCKLYIPNGTYDAYHSAVGWSDFSNIIEDEPLAISNLPVSNIKFYSDQNSIVVKGAKIGDVIEVYDTFGVLIHKVKVTDESTRFFVPDKNIYIVLIANMVFKVAL